ncbi:MAG: peptidoglycan editing factor PgeF [Pseudomonadota bacterium]
MSEPRSPAPGASRASHPDRAAPVQAPAAWRSGHEARDGQAAPTDPGRVASDAPGLLALDWPAPANVRAFTTTRGGGQSEAPFSSLNLGFGSGDVRETVNANRHLVAAAAAMPDEPAWLSQVHGTKCVDAADVGKDDRADASYTSERGRVCAIMTADCLPVLICDAAGTQVAAAHAGWRGLAAGVIESTVAAFESNDLLAWLGPCIGPEAFEVGPEVRTAFIVEDTDAERCFVANRPGHWLADLHGLARLRLARAGIADVYALARCTYTETSAFFSYRRDGQTGRMASFIWLD